MNASPSESQGHTAAAEYPDDSRYLVYGRLAEQIHAELQAGRPPDVEALIAQHPQLADEIRQLASAQVMLHELGHASADPSAGAGPAPTGPDVLGQLGDFRIQGEIGRGGMGVVYEAQQISLRRRVALKVLPFAAVLDPKHLQRFQNEARAAASLRHPNIVQVFSVGCQRGVHYYAMDYIEGQTLAEVISQASGIRGQESGERSQESGVSDVRSDRIHAVQTGPDESGHYEHSEQSTDSPPSPDTSPLAALSTETSPRDPEFFRAVARLGIQAAEALEHAHGMGVVHRDIKPSNLMVDARGHLWITDFGLAMTQTDANLTMTGDLLGTLRYMSPEQVQAKHGVLDHRTDVYSLGLTLYELLTLQPAFPGDDRQKLLRQVAEDDPHPPRQLNSAIPKDLETIVLKATAKEPEDRYPTAQELAEDLRRFLEDRLIQARRPSLMQKATKWTRRHRAAISSAIVLLVLATVGLAVSTLIIAEGRGRERTQRQRAERNLRLALDALDQVYLRLADKQTKDYLELVRKEPPSTREISAEEKEFLQGVLTFYQKFVDANRDQPSVWQETAKAYTRVGSIRQMLKMEREADEAFLRAVETASALVDRFPNVPEHRQSLVDVYLERGKVYSKRKDYGKAIADFSEALRLDRRNIAARYERASAHDKSGGECWTTSADGRGSLSHLDQAVNDCTEIIRLDPSYADAYGMRGNVYLHSGKFDPPRFAKAVADYREAIRLDPLGPQRHGDHANLGWAYMCAGKYEEALACFNEIIQATDSRSFYAFEGRADVYARMVQCGKAGDDYPEAFDKAVDDYTKAIELDPGNASLYVKRSDVQARRGEYDEALAGIEEAIRRDPKHWISYLNKGRVHAAAGNPDRAVAAFSQAIRLNPRYPELYWRRGNAHFKKGDYDKAISDYEQTIRLNPRDAGGAYWGRGNANLEKGDYDKAISDYEQAIRLEPKVILAHNNLSVAYKRKGQFEKALAAAEKAFEIDSKSALACNGLAWDLVARPDSRFCDPDRAVELASRAVEQCPKAADFWNTLGVARYRTGNWKPSIEALEKAVELRTTPHPADGLFLAMAYWKSGQREEAHRRYHGAVELIDGGDQEDDEELRRFRAEAEQLLSITQTGPQAEEEAND